MNVIFTFPITFITLFISIYYFPFLLFLILIFMLTLIISFFSFDKTISIILNFFTTKFLSSIQKNCQLEACKIFLEAILYTFWALFFYFVATYNVNLLLFSLNRLFMPSIQVIIYQSNIHILHLASCKNYLLVFDFLY